MGLDEPAVLVDAHQLAVGPHGDRPLGLGRAAVLVGHRVQSVLVAHVEVGVDEQFGPVRGVKALLLKRLEPGLLQHLELFEGPLAGGAVDPQPRHAGAPAQRRLLGVLETGERLTAEEAVSHVGHLALDVGLSLGMAGHGRVDDEPAVPGVLLEGSLEGRIVAVRLDDGRLEVVDDRAVGHAAEELPGVLQTLDQIRHLLSVGQVHVLVAAEDQGDHQGVYHPPPAGGRVREQAQLAEVHLRQLTGFHVHNPHRGLVPAELQVLDREAVQRAVGDLHPVPFQQTLDLGQPQTTLVAVIWLEPCPDLLLVLQEPSLCLARRGIPGAGLEPDRHPRRQLLVWLDRATGLPAQPDCQADVPADGVTGPTGDPAYGPAALPAVNSLQYIKDFPHAVLQIGHRTPPLGGSMAQHGLGVDP